MSRFVAIFSIILCTFFVQNSHGHSDEIRRYYLNLLKNVTDLYQTVSESVGIHLPQVAEYPQLNSTEDRYDFIVVGGGSAGAVVASRLSEIPEWRVLLLEAGGAPSLGTEIPAVAGLLAFTDHNWHFLTEPQQNFGNGFINNQIAYTRGRGLGGSSLINYMYATRGSCHDYNAWGKFNPGWSCKDVLPYFLKSEDYRVKYGDAKYHHDGGYLTIEEVLNRTFSSQQFVAASQQAGLRYGDYNGVTNSYVVSFDQTTTRNGRRCSTEKAFLQPAKNRRNLHILTGAQVTKVLINARTRETLGVQYHHNNRNHTVYCKKEVILSAGSLQSPQLLMLSGIGPKKHLRKFNITVIENLPVGQKLYDHLIHWGLMFTMNSTREDYDLLSVANMEEYVRTGDNVLTRQGGSADAISFVRVNQPSNFLFNNLFDINKNRTDIEFLSQSRGREGDRAFGYTSRITEEAYNAVFRPVENQTHFQICSLLLHPSSYGSVELRSSNPFDPPRFYGNYLTDRNRDDIKTLIQSIRHLQELIKQPAFRKYNATLYRGVPPGCEQYRYDSDDYWECNVRSLGATLFHQTTTCKMGPRIDREAVVDHKLRVHGVKNLRVIDASIMPEPVSGHTNLPTIMIGERGSDLIKQDYGVLV